MSRRPKLVVLGMMTKMPVAGVVWQTVHYLLGFERLGYETYDVEAHARTPSMLMESADDDSSSRAAAFVDGVMRRFGLPDRWAFHALHDDGRCYGISKRRLRALYRDAALVVNLHGGTEPHAAHAASGRLVYLETDPVQLQVELHDGIQATYDFLEPHCAFFSFAENLGGDDCRLPVSDRYRFHPTRQPVALDLWGDVGAHSRPVFTTVGNWQQHWRSVRLDGEEYHWSKHHEFLKVLDLPERTGQRFELALASLEEDSDHSRLLAEHGWRVRDALALSTDLDAYRRYVGTSRGEFTVAKDQNVRLRTGWFSDRSATYLACGRPVVTQDTGFGCALPVGEGLFAYSSVEEATEAVGRINADYRAQRRAAAEIAREHFDARLVLSRLLDDVGLAATSGAPSGPSPSVSGVPSTVAVVIPCRDLGVYLPETVASVRGQTRPPDELVVVDDGSEETATLEVLAILKADGVRVLHIDPQGAPAARNHGIRATQSEFILCLDADDVLCPEFLERTVAALDADPEAGVATTHVEFFGDRTGIWETSGYDPALLMRENCIASASLFRRVSWRETPGYANLLAGQDWDLWLSMVERGWRWACVPEVLYRYRVREGSLSDAARGRRREVVSAVLGRHADSYRKNALPLIVDLDAEVVELRSLTRERDRDLAARDGEILRLRDELAAAREPRPAEVRSELEPLAVAASVFGADPARRATLVARADGLVIEWHAGGQPQAEDLSAASVARAAEATDVLVGDAAASGLIEQRRDLVREVEARWHATVRDARGIAFDLRREVALPTFSVVVCTHGRPDSLAEAVASVLSQDYPRDRFELIVIDNEPSAAARNVVADVASGPVPVTYHVEQRSGLSFARNAGIARAQGEYVVFLDDDAVAEPHWLMAFAATINQRGALVVGGRVSLRVVGGEAPPWLGEQYVRGFFGIDYADWGRPDRVFRVRPPLYLGGGNSAYARRLFGRFGGFPGELGRTAGTLRAAEETYLNALLVRGDIPLYYDADAVVHHVVDVSRIARRELRRKAYWAGVSDRWLRRLLGEEDQHSLRDTVAAVGAAVRSRRSGHVTPSLKAAYAIGSLRAGVGTHTSSPGREIRWGIEDWLGEVERWPEGLERLREEANALLALGREADAQEQLGALARIESALAGDNVNRSFATRRMLRAQYEQLVRDIRSVVDATLPEPANVAVVSKGDDALLDLPRRTGWHFPQDLNGVWAGHYPADSEAAVEQIEEVRRRGADFVLFPVTSLWWLEHYSGLARHLEREYRLVASGEPCTIYDLRVPVATAAAGAMAVSA